MTPYLHLWLIWAYLRWALIVLVNTGANWQQPPIWHAVIIPPSRIKQTKVLLELVYLPRPQLCPSVRGERMMCLADWVEKTFLDLCRLTFLHHPGRQTEMARWGKSNDGGGGGQCTAVDESPISPERTNADEWRIRRKKMILKTILKTRARGRSSQFSIPALKGQEELQRHAELMRRHSGSPQALPEENSLACFLQQRSLGLYMCVFQTRTPAVEQSTFHSNYSHFTFCQWPTIFVYHTN